MPHMHGSVQALLTADGKFHPGGADLAKQPPVAPDGGGGGAATSGKEEAAAAARVQASVRGQQTRKATHSKGTKAAEVSEALRQVAACHPSSTATPRLL